MRHRNFLLTFLVVAVLLLSGCAALDAFFGLDPVTGTVDPNNPSTQVIPGVAPFAPPSAAPWLEIAGYVLAGLGTVYLTYRKVVSRWPGKAVNVVNVAPPAGKGKSGSKKTT